MSRRKDNPEARMALREHLIELRNRVFKATLAILAGSVVGWFLYDPVFRALARPMLDLHSADSQVYVNFTGVVSAFDLKLRMSAFIGLFVSSPVWIYQLWAFITPGLTSKERRYALAFVFTAVPLFLSGAMMAYLALKNFVVFLIGFTPTGAANIIAADDYFDFVMRMMLSFGFSFLLPVVLVALNLIGLISGKRMLRSWRWVLVISLVVGAMATPGNDVTSMFWLAAPLVLLFFVAIGISLLNDRQRARRQAQAEAEAEAEPEQVQASKIDRPADIV